MKCIKSGLLNRSLVLLVAGALFWTLSLPHVAMAQRIETLDADTTITVRTNESIKVNDDDDISRTFSGVVAKDVLNRRGNVVIPKGSDVDLAVRKISDNELMLDLEAITVNGKRFTVDAETSAIEGERREGIGINKRTGKYVGGGAAIGGIIGAITGGGKGAAIGAGAGAAAGAGAQVLTRGEKVRIPAESLITFRLSQPLRAVNQRYRGNRYYDESYYTTGRGSLSIGSDNTIRWNSSERNALVYVQVDRQAPKLFAAGASGVQAAPWIQRGHVYRFVLQDRNGNELARDVIDLRSYRSR